MRKKISLISIILLLFMFFLSSIVKANNEITIDSNETLNNAIKNLEYYSQYEYCLAAKWDYGKKYSVFFIKHIDGLKIAYDGRHFYSNMNFNCVEVVLNSSDCSVYTTVKETTRNFTSANNTNDGKINFTTISIYDVNYEKILFWCPPQVVTVKVTQVEGIVGKMMEIIQMIIPIGLVVLLIFLVISLIVSLIYRKIL